MKDLFQDLRFALRSLTRRAGLSVIVVLTAGLAIGASTALFDLANLINWLPIPGTKADRLVQVYTQHPQPFIGPWGPLPAFDAAEYMRNAASFDGMATDRVESLSLTAVAEPTGVVGADATEREVALPSLPASRVPATGVAATTVTAGLVSGEFFSNLLVGVAHGRPLLPSDDTAGAPAVAVLGDAFFRSHFSADLGVLGSTVLLERQPVLIVGIADPSFVSLIAGNKTDLWLSESLGPRLRPGYGDEPLVPSSGLTAKLRLGVSVATAQAELQNIAQELDRLSPLPTGPRRVTVAPARFSHPVDRRGFRPVLRLFGAAATLLLLLASANITALLLSRSLERAREIAVRLALGASRIRLVRQLLTESLALALSGGALGLVLAWAGRRLFVLWDLGEFARQLRFDHRVLGASLATCVVVGVLFGLAPALAATRTSLVGALGDGAGSVRRGSLRAFQWLAGAQLALATVLLVCTGAIAADLWTLRNADLGFDPEGLIRAGFYLDGEGYGPREAQRFMVELENRVATLPGVRATSRALFLPPLFLDVERTFRRPDDPETERTARVNFIDDSYFDLLGIPVLEGRPFDDRELEGPPTVILNEMSARQTWPGVEPADVIGRTLMFEQRRPSDPEPEHLVVGVVQTIKQRDLHSRGEPIVYLSVDQRPRASSALLARFEGDSEVYIEALKSEVTALDPGVKIDIVRTAEQVRWDALVVQRLQSQAIGLVAVIGVLLSLLGVFGVMQLLVAHRRREIGIRLAVGADRQRVIRWMLGKSARLALYGGAVGLVISFASVRWMQSWLEALPLPPLWVPLGAAGLLAVATLASALVPARRAARIDPAGVLRSD